MKKKYYLYLITFFALLYFSFTSIIGNEKALNLKKLISFDTRQKIKFFLFPHKVIKEKDKIIYNLNQVVNDEKNKFNKYILEKDIKFKNNLTNFSFILSDEKQLNDFSIKFFTPSSDIFSQGIYIQPSSSSYIDFYQDKIFLVSALGVIGFSKFPEENKLQFYQIKNNIDEFLDINQLKGHFFSIKDLKIHNDKIFISFTNEVSDGCWNISVIFADINLDELKFKKIFFPNECIKTKNEDNEFLAVQSGGRIEVIDDNSILLSVGDFRYRKQAQNLNSLFGKIIKINLKNSKYEIISLGHRNPQGLFYDAEKKMILSTEHGPQGGDEVNLINLKKSESLPNYGWPIASYGEHYGGKSEENKNKYKKYPLLKSHSQNGFYEPIKFFVPSIGISQIDKFDDNKYVFSSLKEKSLFFFELDQENNYIQQRKIKLQSRIRDIKTFKDKLYIVFENDISIGILKKIQ